MAAAIMAIKKKQRARQEKGAGRTQNLPLDEDQPPEWATKSRVGTAWNAFWSKTELDDKFWSYQERVSAAYTSDKAQAGVAALIVGNFICTIVQV